MLSKLKQALANHLWEKFKSEFYSIQTNYSEEEIIGLQLEIELQACNIHSLKIPQ